MTTRRKIQNRQRTKNAVRRIKRRNDKIHKLLRSRKNKATRKYSQQKSKMIGGYGGLDYVAFNIYFYPEDIAGEYRKKRKEVMDYDNDNYQRSNVHDKFFVGKTAKGYNPEFCVPYYDKYLFAVIAYDSNNLYVFDNPNFNLGGADMKNEKLRLLIQKLFGIDSTKDPNASKSVSNIIFDKTGKGIVLIPKGGGFSMGGTHKLQQTNIEKARQGKDPYEEMKYFTPAQSATKLLTDLSTLRGSSDSDKLKIQESLKSQLEAIIQELTSDNFKFAVEPTKQIFPVDTPWDAWNSRNSNNYYKGLLIGRSPTVKEYCITQNNDTGNQPIAEEEYDISKPTYAHVGDDNETND